MIRLGIDLTACHRARVGMVTVAMELARAFGEDDDAGFDLTVFASRSRPAELSPDRYRAILSPHRDEVVNKLTWLPLVEDRADLDAVLYPYWPCPPWRRSDAPPAIVVIHDLAFRLRPAEVPWQQRAYLGTLVPRAIRLAAGIVVPSEVTRADLLDCYPLGGLERRVRVVAEGPTPLPPPGEGVPALEPGFLLSVGTIEHRKNHARLLEAYERLRRRIPDAPELVVAGRVGWDCAAEVATLRAAPGVRFLEHVPDAVLATLYRDCGVFVFPSLYEGFGLPLLDAMARGRPSLIGREGALPELAGGTALEVDATDVDAIADGLERLVTDLPLREDLAARARARATEYSWTRAAAQMRDAILEVT